MFRIMLGGELAVYLQETRGDDAKAAALEPGNDLPREPALHSIGLDEYERSLHRHILHIVARRERPSRFRPVAILSCSALGAPLLTRSRLPPDGGWPQIDRAQQRRFRRPTGPPARESE